MSRAPTRSRPGAVDPNTSTNACPFRSLTAKTTTATATLTASGPDNEFVLTYSGENYTLGTALYTTEPLTTWRGRCNVVPYGAQLFRDLTFQCVEGYNTSISPDGFYNESACPPPGADRRLGELHAVFEVSGVGGERLVTAEFPEPRTVFFPWFFPHVGKTPFLGK